MKIVINDHRRIFAVQQEFSVMLPNLNIEFFAKPSKSGAAASKKIVHPNKKLLDCRATHEEGIVEISPMMTIGELKDHFSDAFGLTVEIVRKSESGPDALSVTDRLSLEEVNKQETEI